MPKIRKQGFTIENEWIELEIWYTSKGGFFFKGLPEKIKAVTKFHEEWFNNEGDLVQKFLCVLNDYHKKISQKRKVIMYRLYGSRDTIMNINDDRGSYTGIKPGVSKKFKTLGGCPDKSYFFGFDYKVLIEISGREIEYFHVDSSGNGIGSAIRSRHSGDTDVIDWTAEREEFFKGLQSNVQGLVNMVSTFFDKDDLLELMDGGINKMLGSGDTAGRNV